MGNRQLLFTLTSLAIGLVLLGVLWYVFFAQNASAPSTTDTTPPPPTTQKEPEQPAPAPTQTTKSLTLYYIAIGDAGKSGTKIGCDDSLVPVKTAPQTFSNEVKAAFDTMLGRHDQYFGESGLYNALYQSHLTFVSSSVKDDMVTIKLEGNTTLGGVCDIPRVEAQLEQLAKTAAQTKKASIYLNNKTLADALSLK